MSKRKRVVLTFNDKINIIESLKKGETGRTLATKYGVGTSTISDIKKNTDSILKFTCKLNKDESIHRKAMKKPNNELLEEALHRWYLQKRSTGQPISGPLICKKALQLNKKISGNESFVASSGWLHRYKTRYGINDLQIRGRKISGNIANTVEDNFREKLIENEYDLDFVYNAAETRLYWKLLPSKAFVSWQKKSALANKTNEERVTLLVCANATGTHKLPLLLIGKLKNPTCFKNIRIPLLYNNEHNACMDTEIFIDWYDSIFIPEVKKYQNQIDKHGSVLLLLNNTSMGMKGWPSAIFLERENGIFKVKLLSSNMSSLSQPMDSVIITLKRLYRKQLLCRLLSVNDDNAEISFSFCKQMNLKECCYILVDAWDLIKKNVLNKAWNTILKQEDRDYISNTDDSILEDIYKLVPNIRICEKCDADDIKAWLDCEITDQDFQIMSDDEILENVLQINGQKEIKEEETEENEKKVPSHVEAFRALETAFKWYERQTECDTVSLLLLKRILDVAAIKRKNDINCLYEVTIKKQIKLE